VEREQPFGDFCDRTSSRVLLLPPTPRDAEAICGVLTSQGIECSVHPTMGEICAELERGAGALVVSEEAVLADSDELRAFVSRQPVWSDLPIIVLSRSGVESPRLNERMRRLGNVVVIERPVRVSTFSSVVRLALRGRARQYQVRKHWIDLELVQAERTALWESERAARAEAEQAGRIKDEFLATLSHEIRTPLGAILGWTHILQQFDVRGEELHKGLEVIERNAQAQSRIVSDLLDMNRILTGKMRLDVRHMELAPVVHAALDTVRPAASAKHVRLHVSVDDDGALVRGDPERLQQVFWNLLANAVKFTPEGGSITVDVRHLPSHAEVTVTDTGAGISEDFLPHVFERFRQADGSTTRRYGGLGLGLAIVKQLVELHGGVVRAESPGPGLGATFTVALPLAAAKEHPRIPPPVRPRTGIPPLLATPDDIADIRVLVVDDEEDTCELVRRLLERSGASVVTASSASEALEHIRAWRPHVLVSDIGMPEEDGYALIRRVRALEPTKGGTTAAIALTAYARAEDRASALLAGFQYHVAKPVEANELVAVVASAARQAFDAD
jgi:signal transduction histidine kinase/ActR/RegA family two-component response regulator